MAPITFFFSTMALFFWGGGQKIDQRSVAAVAFERNSQHSSPLTLKKRMDCLRERTLKDVFQEDMGYIERAKGFSSEC